MGECRAEEDDWQGVEDDAADETGRVELSDGPVPAEFLPDEGAEAGFGAGVGDEHVWEGDGFAMGADGLADGVVVGEQVGEGAESSDGVKGGGAQGDGRSHAGGGEAEAGAEQDAGEEMLADAHCGEARPRPCVAATVIEAGYGSDSGGGEGSGDLGEIVGGDGHVAVAEDQDGVAGVGGHVDEVGDFGVRAVGGGVDDEGDVGLRVSGAKLVDDLYCGVGRAVESADQLNGRGVMLIEEGGEVGEQLRFGPVEGLQDGHRVGLAGGLRRGLGKAQKPRRGEQQAGRPEHGQQEQGGSDNFHRRAMP